jgi:hypothetical protein
VAVRNVWCRWAAALLALAVIAGAASGEAAEKAKKKAPAKAKAAPPAAPVVPGEHPPEVKASFTEFCGVWMGKLVEREINNKKNVKWRPAATGVEGEYIGYSTEHTCDLRPPSPSGVAVGRLIYREMVYRKRGNSPEAAGASEPEIVDVTEITEIFRREKGKWVY